MWTSSGEAVGLASGPVCSCAGIDAAKAAREVRDNRLTAIEDLLACPGFAGACGVCRRTLEAVLARVDAELLAEGLLLPEELSPAPLTAAPVTPVTPTGLVSLGGSRPGGRPLPLLQVAAAPKPAAASRLTRDEKLALIEETIAALRPRLQADGGDCEFAGLEEDRVLVRLTGRCVGCQQASVTTEGIQQRLVERLGQFVRVVPVAPGAKVGQSP
jgi:NifU-like protein